MPDMHTAIPCTGSTAGQAVSTIYVQLGAAKHLTKPLAKRHTSRSSFDDGCFIQGVTLRPFGSIGDS